MSNRWSKPDRLRFSGPELGDLLDRVMAEHGEEAAIAAVNRVRSGGVAGFFCREEFEVVVDPDREPEVEIEPRVEVEPEPRVEVEPETEPEDDEETPVFAGPVAPGLDTGRDRFLALLERRLEETSATEPELTTHLSPVAPAPAPAPSPPVTPTPGRRDRVEPNRPRPAFWRRIDRATDELASFLPTESPLTAVVGPLASATAVVHRLQSTAGSTSADVVVLTDRAGIVSEPSWELERSGDRLIRRLARSDGRPSIVVIDVPVDLPSWVGPLQRRLRSVGVGLFRYAIPGQPSGDELERYRQGADVPYAIDLTSRVEPERVVALVAERHPVVSVAGADLGPELLLALRRHVGGAELLFEPVIDG